MSIPSFADAPIPSAAISDQSERRRCKHCWPRWVTRTFGFASTAGRSLASHGEAAAEAIPPIIWLLRTEDPNLRDQAAEILGKFGPSARVASAALLVALDDEKDYVRKSAENALNAVSPIESETADEALEALRHGDISQRLAAVCDLVRPGSTAQQEIHSKTQVEALRDGVGRSYPERARDGRGGAGAVGSPGPGGSPGDSSPR